MDQRNSVVVDSPDFGDVPPRDVIQFVEQLRNELPNTEVHAAWEMKSAAHVGDYWPQIILWVTGDGNFLADTLRAYVIVKVFDPVASRLGKVCIKFARTTDGNKGKVFKRVYVKRGEEPEEEDVSEDEQETVTQSPLQD